MEARRLSIVRACAIVRFSRAAWYTTPPDPLEGDSEVISALQAQIKKHPRHGFWKRFGRIRRKGKGWNHKRVYRVYCALKLNLPRRAKRRLPSRPRQPLDAYLFSSIDEVRAITEEWLEDYNTERPHDSLGRVPPRTFLPRFDHTRESSFELST